jgi:hypothetical protein
MSITPDSLTEALETLGEILTTPHEIVVIGGGSLLLLGLIRRPTKDLDIVARVEAGTYQTANPLPEDLVRAVRQVALALNLDEQWLNGGPTELLQWGLPKGFADRVISRTYGMLTLQISSRYDQIHFKLYAAVDQGPKSKHFVDLQHLNPSLEELQAAALWCLTHDDSEGFRVLLTLMLKKLGVD